MTIVGVDLSLTGTGLARLSSLGPRTYAIETKVVLSSGKKDDLLCQRHDRQTTIAHPVLEFILGPMHLLSRPDRADLVVIEGLFSSGPQAGHLIDRAGLWWRIVSACLNWSIPVVVVSPMQGKKFLTGDGRADKGAMAMYAGKLWPEWEPSSRKNANDEADALAFGSIGVGLRMSDDEWPFPATDYRIKIVNDLNTKQKLREPA